MSTSPMDEAVLAIARGAGDDLVLLQPPDERHLDPFTVVFAFAAMLAASYMQGLVASFRKEAESLGERTEQRIKTALVHLFRGQQETSGPELVGLAQQVAAAIATDKMLARQAADAARMHLVDALVSNGLPAERALRLAAAVQREVIAAATASGRTHPRRGGGPRR